VRKCTGRFLGVNRARGTVAPSNLATVRTVVESVYASVQADGKRNFLGAPIGASDTASKSLADRLNEAGEDFTFVTWNEWVYHDGGTDDDKSKDNYIGGGSGTWLNPDDNDRKNFRGSDDRTVWVQLQGVDYAHTESVVYDSKANPPATRDYTFRVDKGRVVRFGLRASNGETYCMILVKEAATTPRTDPDEYGEVHRVGVGYQVASESDSTAYEPLLAHCGAHDWAEALTDSTPDDGLISPDEATAIFETLPGGNTVSKDGWYTPGDGSGLIPPTKLPSYSAS